MQAHVRRTPECQTTRLPGSFTGGVGVMTLPLLSRTSWVRAHRALSDENGSILAGILSDTEHAQLAHAVSRLATAPHRDVLFSVDDPFISSLQSYITAKAMGERPLHEVVNLEEVQFDEKDLTGWIAGFFTWYGSTRKHPMSPPRDIDPLEDIFNVAILGDWGSGLYGAPISARSIEAANDVYALLLHLGGVCHSGTETEVGRRFLRYWPDCPGARSRALNSSYEMFSGGHGYFDLTLNAFHQPSSYFAMANDRWLFIGLDSAYDADSVFGKLGDVQLQWLRDVVAKSGRKRIVLFSHHPPISLLDAAHASPFLRQQLSWLLTTGKVAAWYWGHEHRCAIYDPISAWGNLRPRCVGHGGFPHQADKALEGLPVVEKSFRKLAGTEQCPVGALVLVGDNPYVPGHERDYGPHGYLTLHVRGDTLTETVRAPDGSKLLESIIK
jgi:hypothetical protein